MEEKKLYNGFLSNFSLRMIAVVSMICDHVGLMLFDGSNTTTGLVLRCIGRLAFPIFCFLLTEGWEYTSDRGKYGFRLLVFSLISEVAFDRVFYNTYPYWGAQNVFFTLFLGFVCMCLFEKFHEQNNRFLMVLSILLPLILAYLCKVDYGPEGVALIFIFHILRKKILYRDIAVIVLLLGCGWIELLGILALIPIHMYNGKLGYILRSRLWFYAIYPVHLVILWFVQAFFGINV